MRYVLACALLVAIGCGEEEQPTTGVAESWGYIWSFDSGEPPLRGDLTLYRGEKLSGTVYRPLNYPAGAVWDTTIAGKSLGAVELLNFGNPWWTLACDAELSCTATQVDDGSTGTFQGTRN